MSPFHKDLYGILLISTCFEIIRLSGPFIFGKILDLLVQSQGNLNFQTALVIIAGLGGVRILSLAIDYITDFIILGLLIRTERYISTVTFKKFLDLSLDYHEKVATGKKISLLNKGTDRVIDLVEGYAFEFQPIILQLIVSSILMYFTNWWIATAFTISLFPFLFITYKINQATNDLRIKRHDAYETSSAEIGDAMTNITVVKAFAQENRENSSFSSLRELIKDIFIKEFRKRLVSGFLRSLLMEFFYISMIILGLYQVTKGDLTIGSMVFLINLVERGYSNIYRLGRIYQRVADAAEPVDRITNLLHQKSTVTNSQKPIIYIDMKGKISFRHVTFAYKKKRVLKNLTFTIPQGSFTALVGKSGSGKSTIAKLLSRYYDPVKGEIIIDDKYRLKDLDLDTFRNQCAVVFQDSPIPNRRIWEVIAYSAGNTNFAQVKEQVIKAAKLAYAHEFITEFDQGYHAEVGERGVRLSGGQKQRLAIARALFANPKILIMDEPTSHLDTLSESLIQKALEDLSKEHSFTKIIIAHRLSTVQKADQILVMEKGQLVEKGTHRELLQKNGVYANIVSHSELKN